MYRGWDYYLEEAKKLASLFGVSYSKNTSGYNKGDYNVSFKIDSDAYKNFLESLKKSGVVGFDFRPWSNISSKEKDQALKYLLNQTASSLYAYYRQNNPQPISDLYEFYKSNKNKIKESDRIHFLSEVGRNIYDYFEIISGTLDLSTLKKTDLNGDLKSISNEMFNGYSAQQLYFVLKSNAQKEWLNNNERYKSSENQFKNKKITTFVFDEENIPKITEFENKFQSISDLAKKGENSDVKNDLRELVNISKLPNKGNFKVGFRSETFLKSNFIVGREKTLIFPNNEQHVSYFLVVELDEIIASHNENNFSSSKDYPTNSNGSNINDRNYEGDKNAQAKVASVAQNLIPEIIISTSATASGTPIITIDGIVVSGNNRVMSLKLAKNNFPENYENYKKKLYEELEFGGYDISMSQIYPNIQNPILVRLDADFPSYETSALNRYNQSRSKTERSIDMTIRVQDKLKNSELCNTQLLNLISELEIVSELYNNPELVKRFKKIVLDCGLITENDISNLFQENSLSENGKNFYDNLLLAMVLDRNSLEISQKPGIKSFIKNCVNAILPLVKNNTFEKGNLIKEVNNAILVQNAMLNGKYTDVADFASEKSIFEEDETFKTKKALFIAYLLNDKANALKSALQKYNASLEQNQGESLFGDPMSDEEIFDAIFTPLISDKLASTVNRIFSKKEDTIKNESLTSKEMLILRIETLKKTLKYVSDKAQIESYIDKLNKTLKYI